MVMAARTAGVWRCWARLSAPGFVLSLCKLVSGGWLVSTVKVSELIQDWKQVWRDFAVRWKAGAKRGFLWLAVGVGVTWLIFGWFDEPLLLWLQGRSGADLNLPREIAPNQEGWVTFCKEIHHYTKFEWLNLLGAVLLIAVGFFKKNANWRQAGIALFIAGGLAGLAVQAIKTTNGRPRPSTLAKSEEAQSAYDFRGPTFKGGWRGYPSGHSASVWASCIALGLRFRKWLWPLAVFAGVVAWSRVYGNYHWPTDAIHGSWFGALIGWFFGGILVRKSGEDEA